MLIDSPPSREGSEICDTGVSVQPFVRQNLNSDTASYDAFLDAYTYNRPVMETRRTSCAER